MSHVRQSKPPTFFWQGCFIVLPVTLLALLGLYSLRRDRYLAEQEAQERAVETLRELSAQVGRRLATQWGQLAVSGEYWKWVRCTALPAWPGSDTARLWVSQQTNFQHWFEGWKRAYPEVEADRALFGPALADLSGEVIVPRLWSAQISPPHWYTGLPAGQATSWQKARALEATATDASTVAKVWLDVVETVPGQGPRANAEFALLRLESQTNSASDSVGRFLEFAAQDRHVLTESGLPLSAVAFGAALKAAGDSDLDERLYEGLATQLFESPSLLCSYFLADAERRVRADVEDRQIAVRALKEAWSYQERWQSLVTALLRQIDIDGGITSNFWFNAESNRWLAVLRPSLWAGPASVNGEPVSQTNRVTSISFFPAALLDHLFGAVVRDAAGSWPAYFELRAELEGQPMAGAHLGKFGDASSALLAKSAGVVSGAATEILNPGQGAPGRSGLESVSWPSQPRFLLSVFLADPAALYARQNERSLWFSGLIVAVAGVALMGFVRARRAFWNEHRLSELKTNFVSSVSHELRAPIASVRLMAESLERGKVADPKRQGEYYRLIVQECRRLSSLVANLLDFSRIEQGRKEYEFEPTNLIELVQETLKLMEPRAAERELLVQATLPDLSNDVASQPLLDGRAIQQALINLIDNAFKHAPVGSVVSVGLEQPRGAELAPVPQGLASSSGWQLWVQDQGPGIPASEHERIFERFYRLGSELRRDTQGVGIGLSIVKHIIEAHSGRILVESAPGQGSKFTLELPGV